MNQSRPLTPPSQGYTRLTSQQTLETPLAGAGLSRDFFETPGSVGVRHDQLGGSSGARVRRPRQLERRGPHGVKLVQHDVRQPSLRGDLASQHIEAHGVEYQLAQQR